MYPFRNLRGSTFSLIVLLTLFSSCAKRNLVYFSDMASSDPAVPIKNFQSPKIQPDDILSITVSSLSAESNVLFNNVLLPANGNVGTLAEKINEGYLVDKNGAINFPVIGRITLG